jgi:hypothetical protein
MYMAKLFCNNCEVCAKYIFGGVSFSTEWFLAVKGETWPGSMQFDGWQKTNFFKNISKQNIATAKLLVSAIQASVHFSKKKIGIFFLRNFSKNGIEFFEKFEKCYIITKHTIFYKYRFQNWPFLSYNCHDLLLFRLFSSFETQTTTWTTLKKYFLASNVFLNQIKKKKI